MANAGYMMVSEVGRMAAQEHGRGRGRGRWRWRGSEGGEGGEAREVSVRGTGGGGVAEVVGSADTNTPPEDAEG